MASLLLLLGHGMVLSMLRNKQRNAVTRLTKAAVILLIALTGGIPILLALTGEQANSRPVGCFLLFFPIFCYYLGKSLGTEKGRRSVADLVGFNDYEGTADIQDRLYESRMRLTTQAMVAMSIKELAEKDKTALQSADNPDLEKNTPRRQKIMDVAVEDV